MRNFIAHNGWTIKSDCIKLYHPLVIIDGVRNNTGKSGVRKQGTSANCKPFARTLYICVFKHARTHTQAFCTRQPIQTHVTD